MSRFAAGDVIGRYRVERLLGQGAMGEVYLARDPHIDRLLAVKTLRPTGLADDEIGDRRSRMLREARAAGRLVHPHIVTLFDAGEHGEHVFLAFEYVAGTDLGRRLAAGPPPTVGEALRIARETAEGLAAAHRHGIVHRDVKPTNLLLAEDGRVKISDFGIAKLAGEVTELTVAGTVLGSPHYLSPEQVRGEPLDGRSDLFSLGIVLYEMLSGRRPFGGQTLSTLVYQILSTDPAPLALPADLAPLAALLGRLLAKDRDHRLGGAAELSTELARLEHTLPPPLLGTLPGDDVESTLVIPSTAEMLPPVPQGGEGGGPAAGAAAGAAMGGVSAETSGAAAPGHVSAETSRRATWGGVSAEISGAAATGNVSAETSRPVPLPAGSVPPASGTYSLPAARSGRSGRIATVALATVILLGAGLGTFYVLRPGMTGGSDPRAESEGSTTGAAGSGTAAPGAAGTALPGEPGPGTPEGTAADAGALPPRPLVQALERFRERRGLDGEIEAPATPAPLEDAPGERAAAGEGGGDLPRPGILDAVRSRRQGHNAGAADPSSSDPLGGQRPPQANPASGTADDDPRRSSSRPQLPPGAAPGQAAPGRAAPDQAAPGQTSPGQASSGQAFPDQASPGARDRAGDARPAGPAIATGMRLAIRVMPPDAFVLVDGTVVGRAAQFGARSPLLLASPGEHRLTLRRAGMADRHLRIVASESTPGVSPIVAALEPLAAGETPFHELEVHRVGKAVAFRVDPPTTRVLVDGVDRGLAARYRGGRLGGGNWLELPLGMHRVSLVAPGRRRIDVAVDVTSGADEERRLVRLSLPPAEDRP